MKEHASKSVFERRLRRFSVKLVTLSIMLITNNVNENGAPDIIFHSIQYSNIQYLILNISHSM